jgi:hypothetical protein
MSTGGASRALAACCAVGVLSCSPQFPAPNLVDRPRIIAMRTDPVVVMAGQTLEARAMFAGAELVTVRAWRVCVPARIDPFPEQRCADDMGAVAYRQEGGDTLRWQVPSDQNELTTLLFAAFVDANGNIPNINTALNQLRNNGAELLVYVEAEAPGGVVLRGVKRTLFALSPLRYTPISAMRFTFAGIEFEARDERCVPSDGALPVEVEPGARLSVSLVPVATEMELDGAHYADGGDFPLRFEIATLNTWVAPAQSGAVVRHWVVAQRNVPRGSGATVSDVRYCSFTTRSR